MARYPVESEGTGTVWKVEVTVGDSGTEGDGLVIIESMKMEIPVESPQEGTVTELLVQPEDSVEEDQVVAFIED